MVNVNITIDINNTFRNKLVQQFPTDAELSAITKELLMRKLIELETERLEQQTFSTIRRDLSAFSAELDEPEQLEL